SPPQAPLPCDYPGVPSAQPDPLSSSRDAFPLTASGVTMAAATLYPQADEGALPATALPLGTRLTISQWAADGSGRPWYHVSANGTNGWVWSGTVRLEQPNPATREVHGAPIWTPIAGKGMVITNYLARHSNIDAVIQAARQAGLTHLYTEVAFTQAGFYARNTLDRLLPAAHKAGIAVIPRVYVSLQDIATDVRLTTSVAAYAAPSGDRPDGVATYILMLDEKTNQVRTNSASIYTYGQLVRALLGPDNLLVAQAIPPFDQIYFPYAAIATSWNVIAPADNWHSLAKQAYSQADVRHFVASSIATVQAAMGADGSVTPLPIEELGPTWDSQNAPTFTGAKNAPTGPEITADMDAARAAGSIGVSYFEWQTATQAQWAALIAYKWPST